MSGILRFVGVVNAAVWLGAAVCFTFVAAPAMFSAEMKEILGPQNYPFYSGRIAQMVVARFFVLQYVCGAIALAHLLVEWLHLGRPLLRLTAGLATGLFALGLAGGLWLQPKLKQLHQSKYAHSEPHSPAAKEQVARSFRVWHGVSQAANLLALIGLTVYVARVASPGGGPRFSRLSPV